MITKYLIIHNKHEGCYDFHYYEDKTTKMRLTSITINPPKVFYFNEKESAHEFFNQYINDIDVLDIRCKKENDEVHHIDYCTCGCIEMDDDNNPILFYNKKNQIFFLETGAQMYTVPAELGSDISHFNLTNKLIRTCKNLGKDQLKRYVELGKMCEKLYDAEQNDNNKNDNNNQNDNNKQNDNKQNDNNSNIS
jgi:hypothetical protein